VRVDVVVLAPYIHTVVEDVLFEPLKGLGDEVEVEVRGNWTREFSVPEGKI
jgi:hypothetical protein